MNKRRIRRHFSGTANLQLTSQAPVTSGETFYDSMRRTITQSLSKQLPSIAPKYGDPIIVDPRTHTIQKSRNKKVFSHVKQSQGSKPYSGNREESYKNDTQQIKPVLFNNNQGENEKLQNIQKLLRRKYASRTKMFSIFNGWDGEPKGYINHQNLRSVLGLMGVNLTEQESKDFIRMHSADEDKLNLNSFLNIIYSQPNDFQKESKQEGTQLTFGDDRFKNNFNEQQYDCRNLKMENINNLDSYSLQKALFQGQRIKNKLQRHFKSEDEVREQLLGGDSRVTVKFTDIKNKMVEFLQEKQGRVKWRELQSFLSLYQYNINQELDVQTFCKGIFDNSSILQKNYIHQNSAPVQFQNRLSSSAHSNFSSFKPINIQKCLKKIDQQIFRASVSYDSMFHKFDKDKDGYVSEDDFVKTMVQQNLLTEEESRSVFDHIGGNNGRNNSCMTFKEFSDQMKPGMGTQAADQYPNFLRPKKVNEFRETQRFTKSSYFDPKCTQDMNQRKTRFSGTPMYNYSTLGADGTKFWGKSGDLNSKIQFQKQQKHKLSSIQRERLLQIACNREADDRRREQAQSFQQIRAQANLQKISQLKGAYQKINHRS